MNKIIVIQSKTKESGMQITLTNSYSMERGSTSRHLANLVMNKNLNDKQSSKF